MWSFGSRVEGNEHRRDGYVMLSSGNIIRMGIGAAAGTNNVSRNVSVLVVLNEREKLDYNVVLFSNYYYTINAFYVPLLLHNGDAINFKSTSNNHDVTSVVVSLLIELDV